MCKGPEVGTSLATESGGPEDSKGEGRMETETDEALQA